MKMSMMLLIMLIIWMKNLSNDRRVLDFVKSLGFDKVRTEETDDSGPQKKVKLLKMPLTKDEQKQVKDEDEASNVKKKKAKNKFKVQVDEVSSSSDNNSASFTKDYQPRNKLLIKCSGKWFDHKFDNDPESFEECSPELVAEIKRYTEQLMDTEAALFKQEQDSNKHSDARWIRTVLSSGTLADKTAALTLLVQRSPIHNLQGIDTLIGMVKKKCRRESLAALDNVKELWLSDLLPGNRKLCTFDQHPLYMVEQLASGNKESRDKRLMLWYFEDQLKQRYETFIEALQAMTHDSIVAPKKKALSAIFDMLAGKPEQEQQLLTVIINKLGDPETKVATLGAHLLGKLVQRHPNMKMVVCVEVENMLYRKNIAEKAQYYGICFLNQIVLSHSERALAAKLIAIYFSFFQVYAEKKKVESKMLSALLTGVNRAFPYAKIDLRTMDKQLNSIFRIVHIGQFNTGLQALMLLFQVVHTGDPVMCDRYYQTLYKKLLDPELQNTSRHPMFLNLLYKSLKKDDTDARIKAFLKRLLQICSHMSPTFICGSLVLVSELLKSKPALLEVPRINQEIDDLDSGDEEEKFTDVKADSDLEDEGHLEEVRKALSDKGHTTVASWLHRSNTGKSGAAGHYDPSHRNPMYCHAERECVWELRRLAKHYHPSVVLFANKILKGEPVTYQGDPLQDFVLIRFLDRFVYRNPKKLTKNVVSSLDRRSRQSKVKGAKAIAVNDQKYINMEEDRVPVDEKFFYKYFKQEAQKTQKKKVEDLDSDAESVDDDEFDAFLDKYEANFEGAEDIEFDFAGEFDKERSKRKKKRANLDSDSEEDMDGGDLDDDLSDEEVDFGDLDMGDMEDWEDGDSDGNEAGSREMAPGKDAGFDEEEVAFSDQDELEGVEFSSKPKKRKQTKVVGKAVKKSKFGKDNTGSLFAAAEEFASLMDEDTSSKFDLIGSEAYSTKDNAHVKQLKWESHRDKWVRGQDWRSKKWKQQKSGKAFGKQKKKFNK